MNKKTMKRSLILTLCLSLTLSLCGCSKSKTANSGLPDNDPCNNGLFAIMETENGYYANAWCTQNLRYYDKETGNDIYLCTKPECSHDGSESCTATYRNLRVVNSVLYDGAIYILSIETGRDEAGYYLYRAALDGSSLDQVGCAFSAKVPTEMKCLWAGDMNSDADMSSFIIHRGYAYIPFYLAGNESTMGFINGGLIKMDIQSGKSEQIYAMSYIRDGYPQNLRARGDYVYFDLRVSSSSKKATTGTFCYDTKNDNVFCPFGEGLSGIFAITESEEQVFFLDTSLDEDNNRIFGLIPYNCTTDEPYTEQPIYFDDLTEPFDARFYQDRFFLYTENKLSIHGTSGEKLGELAYPLTDGEPYHYIVNTILRCRSIRLQLLGDQIYAVCIPRPDSGRNVAYEVYSCPIADIITGCGSWTLAYTASREWLPSWDDAWGNWSLMTYDLLYY